MSNSIKFSSLDLQPTLLSNLVDIGYEEMTLVQAETLPQMIGGSDVLARAKTGSGKTAAFGLGLLNKLDATSFRTQALVLCPTRELADQIAKEIRRLARGILNVKILTLCGGVPLRPWWGYQALATCHENSVMHKLLFGSDFPICTIAQTITALRDVNRFAHGTGMPQVPENEIESLIHRDALPLLGLR